MWSYRSKIGFVLGIGALGAGFSQLGRAQEAFTYEVPVESTDFPNLNTELVITGDVGQSFEFTGNLTIGSSGITGEEGAQGWSCGIRNEKVEILSTTVDGTVSADSSKGGLVSGGFVVSELIDPAKNGNKQGMVQAIVLSFVSPVSLPPNTNQIIAKNKYKATITEADAKASIRYEDGLIGRGQPVQNNVTFKGNTKNPTLGKKEITIKKKVSAQPEQGRCNDGVDNDLDGKTDCADSDCDSDPQFCGKPEVCNDGVDNDKDGKTDCADSECATKPECLATDKGFDLILDADDSHREGNKNIRPTLTAPGTEVLVEVSIAPTKNPEPDGAQGWSISVNNDSHLEIQNGGGFPTLDGTDAGAKFNGGFQKTEVVDPAKNNGKSGFVSAVVLSFTLPITLDPAKNQTIAFSKYKVKVGTTDENFPLTIIFLDNLRGVGQPVPNVLTVKGDTVNPTRLIALELEEKEPAGGEKKFRRGDANDDTKVNIADPIWIINELVRSGPKTKCQSSADANDDGRVDLSDPMYLIDWRFLGGTPPKAPFAVCGGDPTEDNLECPNGSASTCP